MHHDRGAGVLERPPHGVEERVVEVELPDLQVHLIDLSEAALARSISHRHQ